MPTVNPYCVSGAGSSTVNGSYTFNSMTSSDFMSGYWEKIDNSNIKMGHRWAYNEWILSDGSTFLYSATGGTGNPPATWYLSGSGVSPVPTVSAGECTTPTPTPTPNTLRIKRSSTTTAVPTTLLEGELAANIIDQKIWIGSSSQVPVLISDINGSGGGIALTDISSSAVGLNYDYTTGNFSTSQGYEIPLTSTLSSITTAYNERLQWDGGATNLITATGRTSLGIDAVENTALSTWVGSTNITTVGAATGKSFVITDTTTGNLSSSYSTFKVSITGVKYADLSAVTSDVHFNLARTIINNTTGGLGPYYSPIGVRITPPTYSGTGGLYNPCTMQIDSAPLGVPNSGATALKVLTGTSSGRALILQGATNQHDGSNVMDVLDSTGVTNFSIDPRGKTTVSGSLIVAPLTNIGMMFPAESGSIKLKGINSSINSLGFKVPDTFSTSILLTLPSAYGTAGQVLSTNASGVLSWVTPSSGSQTITLSGDVSGTGTTAITTTLATVPITKGGTGQVTATAAVNALLPAQTGNTGKYLTSNGTDSSWATVSGGSSVTTSATAPASPTAGNQWYDTTTGIIYTYVNDGTSSQWVQGSTATLATGVPAGGTTNQFLVKSSATDYATAWTGTLLNPTFTNYTETLYDAGTGSAFTLNLSNGTIQKFTTNANMTLTLPASTAGKSFVVMVVYGGVHTLSWLPMLRWVGGTTPTATSVAGKIDIFSFFQDGTNTYGTVYGQNF